MEFEVLKRSHLKRNIIIGVVVVAIISAIILNFTRAKYRVTQSIPIVNGTINYTPYDFKVMAMYQESDSGEYESIDIMPGKGYVINEEQSYCTTDNVNKDTNARLYTNADEEHVIANLQKNSKCYLYFDKIFAKDIILADKTISTRSSFSSVLTADTTGTIYQAEDDDGTTYYFAGNPTDNWVQWAGFYWRIIRINGDGSIRMIYSGEDTGSVTDANRTGETTQIGTSDFNELDNDNTYVGYMSGSAGQSTYNETHTNTTDSTIKGIVDTWYQNNLASYANNIDTNAGFCNDRHPSTSESSSNGSGGTGKTLTYYGAYIRLTTNKIPSFKCSNSSDLFTVSSSSKGNHALDYPIGLITADEVSYAGGVDGSSNSSYYLYNTNIYWTMSPRIYSAIGPFVFFVDNDGSLSSWTSPSTYGVRPVINLKADLTITGSGTSTDPYTVVAD